MPYLAGAQERPLGEEEEEPSVVASSAVHRHRPRHRPPPACPPPVVVAVVAPPSPAAASSSSSTTSSIVARTAEVIAEVAQGAQLQHQRPHLPPRHLADVPERLEEGHDVRMAGDGRVDVDLPP